MKFVLIALLSIVALAQARGGGHSGGHSGENHYLYYPYNPILYHLNETISKLINAAVLSTSNTTAYVWDLLSPIDRFVLLSQTQVSQTGWNVTQEVINNTTRLGWASVPSTVQTILLAQGNLNILNLTYVQFGWSGPNDTFANSVLFSFLPDKIVSIYSNITQLVSDISFSTIVNTTAVDWRTQREIREFSIVSIIPDKRDEGRYKRHWFGGWEKRTTTPRPITAASVANQAVAAAARFICSYVWC